MNQNSLFPEMDPAPEVDLLVPPMPEYARERLHKKVQEVFGNRITLHRVTSPLHAGAWFARHTGPLAEEITRACGTNDICTGFLASADPEEVHTAIARLNPEYLVVIEDL